MTSLVFMHIVLALFARVLKYLSVRLLLLILSTVKLSGIMVVVKGGTVFVKSSWC